MTKTETASPLREQRVERVLTAWKKELDADVANRTERAIDRMDRWWDVAVGGEREPWRRHSRVLFDAAEAEIIRRCQAEWEAEDREEEKRWGRKR